MKKCSKCNISKTESEFNFRNKKLNKLQSSCKVCSRNAIKKHYEKNKKYYLEKARKRNQTQRTSIKKFLYEYLNDKMCIDCGEKNPVVLEFDHRDDKLMAISTIIKKNYPISTVKKELLKCDIRCANCHRKKTAKDFNWYKHIHASVA